MMQGRIIRGIGGFYFVRDAQGAEYTLRARGRFRREHKTPLVGDDVVFTPGQGEEHGWLDEILPRRSECLRPPAANVSLLLVVCAPEPLPDLMLIDRLIIRAKRGNMKAALVINKCDLDPSLAETLSRQYAGAGVPILPVSARQARGLDALREIMRGELCCVCGQSAVGKSTLLNALCGLELKTGELSEKIRRGKNTTRHAELIERGGVAVLDTPGFSLLELDGDMEPETLREWYPEFAPYEGRCRFDPCLHDREPDCAVRAAVETGEISAERWERYRLLLAGVRESWKNRYKAGRES